MERGELAEEKARAERWMEATGMMDRIDLVVDSVRDALTPEQQEKLKAAVYQALVDDYQAHGHDHTLHGDPSLGGRRIRVARSLVYEGDGWAVTTLLAQSLQPGDRSFGRGGRKVVLRVHQGVTEFMDEEKR